MTALDGHEFRADEVNCVTAAYSAHHGITVHRQATGSYLLSLARTRSGYLATPDRRMRRLLSCVDRSSPHLRVNEIG